MGGWRYVGRKVLQAFFTLIFVLVFNFFLFRIMPGDPVRLLTRQRGIELSVQAQEQLAARPGLGQALAGAVRGLRGRPHARDSWGCRSSIRASP